MRVLAVNAGSSSLKLRLLDRNDSLIARFDLPVADGELDGSAIAKAIGSLEGIEAVGHRIVHGGTQFPQAARIDPGAEEAIRALTDLAPLHQPKSLVAFEAVRVELPDVPAVACFDTAFHADIPAAAATYAVPAEWRERWSVRRFGFHGLSHAYASRRAAEMLGAGEGLRIVTCHLGAGASLCAVLDGRSVDTTMGFTPLEGLVMATRSGTVDPGLILWLQQHVGISADELADALEHRSGLVALAGTADMREILSGADGGDPPSRLALEVYVHRLRSGIAAMAASMGGVDALVFTGGVGEHAPSLRRLAGIGLTFLGVEVDGGRNEGASGDADISTEGAQVRTLVLEAREDLQIARETRRVLET
jgi:acetate kinase